jgi:hypothetical protein
MPMEFSPNGDHRDADEARDTMFMMGGVALMIFGAGLILSNPVVRRYLGQANPAGLLSTLVPDVERYLKLRSM